MKAGGWPLTLPTQHGIPADRLAQGFSDIDGIKRAPATFAHLLAKKAKMGRCADTVKNRRSGAKTAVQHRDETGGRIVGKTRGLHRRCSPALSPLRRGAVPPALAGTAVHDCWPANFTVGNVRHGLGNAQLLRALQSLSECEQDAWASDMNPSLPDALTLTPGARGQDRRAGRPAASREIGRRFDTCCEPALMVHAKEPPRGRPPKRKKRGRPKRRTGHKRALRLQAHKPAVLLCLEDLTVPCSNTEAERALSMTKVRQKISGWCRSEAGAENFWTPRTGTETARKPGWDILRTLKTAPDQLILNLRPGSSDCD